MSVNSADNVLKSLSQRELREQLRSRGLNPGGGIDDLRSRLKENMQATGNCDILSVSGGAPQQIQQTVQDVTSTKGKNPPGGASQIVFGDYAPKAPAATTPIKTLDAPSPARQSGTAASFYHSPTSEGPAAIPAMPAIVAGAVPMYGGRPAVPYGVDKLEDSPKPKSGQASIPSRPSQLNNYARPGGNQNLGNKITNRPSSRVLAPPGGASQISFG